MMFNDTQIIHTKIISMKEALLVTSTILFLFAILLIPIYQASVMRELVIGHSQTEKELMLQSEKEHLLRAYLAKSSIPDIASIDAIEKDIYLQKIPFHMAKLVIIKDGE